MLGQRDEEDATDRPIPVIVLPSLAPILAPIKEDEVQIMATPNDKYGRVESSVDTSVLAAVGGVPLDHHQEEDSASIPATEPADPPGSNTIP